MSHMTLLTGPERRRRWGQEIRERILAAAFSPGAVVADVARQFEVSTSLIYKWRRAYLTPPEPIGFAPAVLCRRPSQARSGARARRSWWSCPAARG
jgi:transposase